MQVVPGEPVLSLRGVSKRYGEVLALDDVALEVAPGAVHGLLGRNGAGKTTLLRIVLALVRPDAGRVSLLGRAREHGAAPLPGQVGGFVEAPRCYPYLTGRRNLELLSALDGGAGGPEVADVIEQVRLGASADERAGGYSLGMRQRLGLAAVLLRAPRLLVVDEPANGLDPAGVRDMRALLADQAALGRSVLLSSHSMAEVQELCSDVTVLHRGVVAYDGPLGRLRAMAPPSAVRLRTSDDGAALQVVAGLPAVTASRHAGGGLHVTGGVRDRDLLVHALSRAGVAVRSLEPGDEPLEAAFLALTTAPAPGAA